MGLFFTPLQIKTFLSKLRSTTFISLTTELLIMRNEPVTMQACPKEKGPIQVRINAPVLNIGYTRAIKKAQGWHSIRCEMEHQGTREEIYQLYKFCLNKFMSEYHTLFQYSTFNHVSSVHTLSIWLTPYTHSSHNQNMDYVFSITTFPIKFKNIEIYYSIPHLLCKND